MNPCVFCGRFDDKYHRVHRLSLVERVVKRLTGIERTYWRVCNAPYPPPLTYGWML